MKSIDNQIAAMESRWPEFVVKVRGNSDALWEGVLAPDKREHVVRIRYRVPVCAEI